MKKSITGFTIVELLIVIVVIAILAAISVVAYTGIQNRAHDTTVQNDLSNLKKLLSISFVDNNRYNYNDITTFKATKSSYATSPVTGYNLVFCVSGWTTDNTYGIIALSKSGKKFYVTNTDGIREFTGPWAADATGMCSTLSSSYANNMRGYASEDGPWRAWAGGN